MVGLLKLQETVAKKHKVEENYSSEVSPPCREKTVRIRKFKRDLPNTFLRISSKDFTTLVNSARDFSRTFQM